MKRIASLLIILLTCMAPSSAKGLMDTYANNTLSTNSSYAKITFKNNSDYTMTLKVIHQLGGLYGTVVLNPHSNREVSFGSSNTFKLKIKAVHNGIASYHDGGNFSVTCTATQRTIGEMSFSLSTYGSGLGPKISQKEFERDN